MISRKQDFFDTSFKSSLSPHTLQKVDSYYYSRGFTRILTVDFPKQKYERRKGKDKTTVHFGQRKLHLSEVEFLTIACKDIDSNESKIVMIYAGAASGQHIPTLINMFPFIEYVLVDPQRFHVDSTRHFGKVRFINNLFTNELAQELRAEYNDYTRLFVSDIRSANIFEMSREEVESRIEEDMANQMNWYRLLDPFKAMFKFRLPYVEGVQVVKTQREYLDGTLYFQVWSPPTSSETRLIVGRNAKTKSYNCKQYEDQLFRFNTVERVLCYQHDQSIPGLDHCYDCRAEVFIYEEYTKIYDKLNTLALNIGKKVPKKSVKDLIESFNHDLDANSRNVLLILNNKHYHVKFTDICYGKSESDIFNDRNLAVKNPYGKKYNKFGGDNDDETFIKTNLVNIKN